MLGVITCLRAKHVILQNMWGWEFLIHTVLHTFFFQDDSDHFNLNKHDNHTVAYQAHFIIWHFFLNRKNAFILSLIMHKVIPDWFIKATKPTFGIPKCNYNKQNKRIFKENLYLFTRV